MGNHHKTATRTNSKRKTVIKTTTNLALHPLKINKTILQFLVCVYMLKQKVTEAQDVINALFAKKIADFSHKKANKIITTIPQDLTE